jgi:26S proteasome regulatory subunit N5
MRLESLRGNWTRVRVGSRKVNRTFLKEKDSAVSCRDQVSDRADMQDIKLRYYDLLVQLALQDDIYLEACQAYQEVWDTEEVKADEAREVDVSCRSLFVGANTDDQVIENIIIYVVLAAYSNEQSDMLHKLYNNPALQKAPVH